jgi:hypothetical protein
MVQPATVSAVAGALLNAITSNPGFGPTRRQQRLGSHEPWTRSRVVASLFGQWIE